MFNVGDSELVGMRGSEIHGRRQVVEAARRPDAKVMHDPRQRNRIGDRAPQQ
jgi:hypothetical protein